MTTRTTTKIIGLTLGAALSMTWLSTVVVGMHSASAPAVRTIELPTVVVTGQKSAAVNATAMVANARSVPIPPSAKRRSALPALSCTLASSAWMAGTGSATAADGRVKDRSAPPQIPPHRRSRPAVYR